MAENSGANVTISNYSATLTQHSTTLSGVRNTLKLVTEDGMFYKFMYSTKFYDFDSQSIASRKVKWGLCGIGKPTPISYVDS